jgi:hypothetical protein
VLSDILDFSIGSTLVAIQTIWQTLIALLLYLHSNYKEHKIIDGKCIMLVTFALNLFGFLVWTLLNIWSPLKCEVPFVMVSPCYGVFSEGFYIMIFVLILQPVNYCYYSLVKRRIKHLFAIKNLLEAPKSSATI